MQAISSRSIRCHPPGALVLAGLFVVVGLAIPGHAQTVTSKKSSTDKKETTVTQLATAEVDSDARRHPRQCHALLVDEYGGLFGSSLLGKQASLVRSERCVDPGCCERVSR